MSAALKHLRYFILDDSSPLSIVIDMKGSHETLTFYFLHLINFELFHQDITEGKIHWES